MAYLTAVPIFFFFWGGGRGYGERGAREGWTIFVKLYLFVVCSPNKLAETKIQSKV